MPYPIYRGDLPSSRDSREFYMSRILDIYMCWKCVEYSRIFTSSNVLELPRSFRNWAKLALLVLSWALGGQIGLATWAVRNILPHLSSRRPRQIATNHLHVPKWLRSRGGFSTSPSTRYVLARLSSKPRDPQ